MRRQRVSQPPAARTREKILVVDDESSLLRFLKNELTGWGYHVSTAKSGSEFHKSAFAAPPDLIILDIVLPDGLGTDYYEKLLRSGFDSKIPVIFLSALARHQPPKKKASQEDSRFALFGKPFDVDELREQMRRLLSMEPEGRVAKKGVAALS